MDNQKISMEVIENKMDLSILNPMIFQPRFQHITEQMFKNMDKETLKGCRVVSKLWQECIDDKNLLWNKIIVDEDPNKVFQLAFKNDNSKMVKFLIWKSAEINVDLNIIGSM